MFKTFTINLAGQIYHINEDAFEILSNYLKSLKNIYSKEEGGDEIISDIEARISEIVLIENKSDSKKVIEKSQVEKIIKMLGSPEQHSDEAMDNDATLNPDTHKTSKKMFRDGNQQFIAGVCSGLSQYFGINDPIWLRLLFVISVFAGFGTGILVYIVLWILLPEATTASEKLQMKGEPINIENIEKTIKDGINNVSDKFSNIDGTNTIQKTTRGFGNVLLNILKGILKVVRAFLLIFLVIITLVFVFSFFVTGIGSLALAPALSEFVFESKILAYLTVIAFVILMVVTSLFFILLPFQLFSSNKKPLKNPVGITIGILWIATFLITLLGTADAFRNFSSQKKIHNEEIISATQLSDTIYITTQSVDPTLTEGTSNVGISWDDWKIVTNGIYNGMVKLNIAQSPDQDIHIFEELSSRGNSQNGALQNIKNIDYQYRKSGDTLIFNDYLQNKLENAKFRIQQVEITLYIPEGKIIQFDNVEHIIHKKPRIKNIESDIDYGIENSLWKLENTFLVPLSGGAPISTSANGWIDVTPASSFSEIDISGFLETEIIYAQETKVLVNRNDIILAEIKGNTLQVDMKKGSFNIHPGKEAYKVKIYTPSARKITSTGLTNTVVSGFTQESMKMDVEGSSSLSLNNNTIRELDVQIEGVSSMKGYSNVEQMNLEVEGMSRYEGENIQLKQIQLKLDGNSEAIVRASQSIKGKLTGMSKLFYFDNPSLEVTTNGSSEVQKR